MTARAELPPSSRLHDYRSAGDFMDVYAADLSARPDLAGADIRLIAAHFTRTDMPWAQALLRLRDCVVRPLGLKTTKDLETEAPARPLTAVEVGDRIAFFKVYDISDDEIILGEDDWHQDFRLSIYRATEPTPQIYAATCCKRHNLFGHAYLAAILPFHKMLVQQNLDSGLRRPLAA